MNRAEIINQTLSGKQIYVKMDWAVIHGYESDLSKVIVSLIDITERKRIEAARQESEASYRSLFEDSPISLWEEDFSAVKPLLDGLHEQGVTDFGAYFEQHPGFVQQCADAIRVVNVNKASLSLYGIANKDSLLGSLTKILKITDHFRHELAMIASGVTHFEMETTNLMQDGSQIILHLNWAAASDRESDLAKVIISAIDITRRRQMEDALRQSEQQLRSLVESMNDLVFVVDQDLVIQKYHSPYFSDMLFVPSEQFLGKHLDAVGFPEPAQGIIKGALLQTLESGSPARAVYYLDMPQGTAWFDLHVTSFHENDGMRTKLTCVVRDITAFKQAEENLIKSEAYFRSFFEQAAVGVALTDARSGAFLRINQHFCDILGYPAEELIGLSFEHVTFADDVQASLEKSQSIFTGDSGKPSLEKRYIRKDGTVIWVDVTIAPLWEQGEEPSGYVTIIQDITNRKVAEQEIQYINRELERSYTLAKSLAVQAEMASVAKSEFLANMSHEIRTPLNGVIGMTGLLLDSDLNENQRRYAELVQSSGETLLALINDILDFSKIEAGKLELETLDFDLLSLLDDFAAGMALRAHEKGLELLCAADPGVPARLRGDPGRLRQVLTNLVGNALKFTRHGQVAVRVALISENNGEVDLHFSIQDTGIGIAQDKMDLLFAKFSQVDASTTRQFGGTGLGLAISKQLAELMGGRIGVESLEGQGSEFWFTVCLKLQPGGGVIDIPAPANLNGVRILVVDDNATGREMLVERLSAWGMRPEEAKDGFTALHTLAAAQEEGHGFRVALLDLVMPGMDGATLGRAIKSDPLLDGVRLVLLSSLGERGDARHFEQIGFSGYLVKPLRHTDLYNVLSTVLAIPAGGDAVEEPQAIVTRHSAREKRRAAIDPGKRILLVEDNLTNQQVALGILGKFGLRADTAENGAEALSALERNPYDLVLMDVHMPVMDGLEATRRIREGHSGVLNPAVPIIAMTALAFMEDRERCLAAGMNDYISKPVDPKALRAVLERWLAEKGMGPPTPAVDQAAQAETRPGEETTPVFDRSGLMERLMDDEELARMVIAGFLEDIPVQIQALKEYLDKDDAAGAHRQAHTIKGASANIGGEALRELAFEMEKKGKEGDLTGVRSRMGALERQFKLLKAVLMKEL